jgi:hypothetical protein
MLSIDMLIPASPSALFRVLQIESAQSREVCQVPVSNQWRDEVRFWHKADIDAGAEHVRF